MHYFIANWKANHTYSTSLEWMTAFLNKIEQDAKLKTKLENNELTIIIAPPFPFIIPLKDIVKHYGNIHLASQDISCIEKGKYTGEVTAEALSGHVQYSIIGHSERRMNFNETDDLLQKKVDLANKYGLKTIYCIRNERDLFPSTISLLSYEPVHAIGTGNNENPADVVDVKKKLNIPPDVPFIYGGSANKDNVDSYLITNAIDGFLVGTASVDPIEFYSMCASA